MDDQQIIALYKMRSEEALIETKIKYGRYCHCIAYRILQNYEDTEECLNDMLLKCWDVIPYTPPSNFRAYVAVMTRNLAVSKCRQRKAAVRLSVKFEDTIGDCVIAEGESLEERLCDSVVIGDCISEMLKTQSTENKEIFMRRYWNGQDLQTIADEFTLSEICVRGRIFRMRALLKSVLLQNGLL